MDVSGVRSPHLSQIQAFIRNRIRLPVLDDFISHPVRDRSLIEAAEALRFAQEIWNNVTSSMFTQQPCASVIANSEKR